MYGNYVNSTLEQYGGDLARQTKFNITISLPNKLSVADAKRFPSTLNVLGKGLALPNITHETLEFKYKGHGIPVPARTNFDQSFSITFYLDDAQILRAVLDEWIRGIDSLILGGSSNNLKHTEYYGKILIEALDFDETSVTKGYEFFNIFPKSVSAPEFSSDATSSVIEITVEFAYSYFKTREGTLNVSNIFEDVKNKVMDSAFSAIGDLIGDSGNDVRRKTAAAVDIFKK